MATVQGSKRLAAVTGLAAAGVAADQLTKWWALTHVSDRSIQVMPTVRLAVSRNDGASFSTGAGYGRLVAVLVIAAVAWLMWTMAHHRRTAGLMVLAVVLGGALGNLADRVFRAEDGFLTGHVVDFIDVSWFAVFNVADTLVVVGVIVFALGEVLHERRRRAGAEDLPSSG